MFLSIFANTAVSLMACNGQLNQPEPPAYNSVKEVKITTANPLSTMDGFGASDAWRCQMIGKNWPIEKRNTIADLLFSQEFDAEGDPKGIGLSIWRFYIGAGSMEQGFDSKISDEWRRAESFLNADGTYDWSKQEGQRWFLKAAKERGVEKYLAFTIAPPVHMSANGLAAASAKQANMNIADGKIPDYAEFLVQVIDNLQKSEGIKFDYLSPINESQWDWMLGSNGFTSQEGTPALNSEMASFTKSLSSKLSSKGLSTQIVLGEAAQIDFLYQAGRFPGREDQIADFFDASSANSIKGLPNVSNTISGHSYFTVWPLSTQIDTRTKLNQKVQQYGLKYWQSEYCILEQPGTSEIPGGGGGGRDLGMQTAIFVARIIHNDIAISNATSWQWWTALTRADYKDGLIYLDNGTNNGSTGSPDYCKNDGEIRQSKLLWALGNYSLFVRPGMKRVAIDGYVNEAASKAVMATAYIDQTANKIVVVAINAGKASSKIKLAVDREIVNGKLTPYVTSEVYNLTKLEDVEASEITLSAQSVVTLVGKLK